MKVLVIGGGGREHALCWKLRQSPLLTDLYCAPGNPGIAALATPVPIAVEEVQTLADFASEMRFDLVVVGPELPLALGLADELERRGVPVFGPSHLAAEIEGSKVFAKQLMERHGIPTAPFAIVHDEAGARSAVAQRFGLPVVLKADGLASGKGVFVVQTEAELEAALAALFGERRFGRSADQVLIEACLQGEEVSILALVDGERILPLASAKDYKRLGDGDSGPNTGGMGCHSPSGLVSDELLETVLATVLRPAVAAMAAEGRRFVGVLYAGLMLTPDGPRVLEFNARFGDPEAQALLLRLEDDLLPVLAAGAAGRFTTAELRFRPETAACVVLASPGYPDHPVPGEVLGGLDRAAALPGVEVFHAGTAKRGDDLVSAGGRVLNVCALGGDLGAALALAYRAVEAVDWPAKVFRRDLGRRVLAGHRDNSR